MEASRGPSDVWRRSSVSGEVVALAARALEGCGERERGDLGERHGASGGWASRGHADGVTYGGGVYSCVDSGVGRYSFVDRNDLPFKADGGARAGMPGRGLLGGYL